MMYWTLHPLFLLLHNEYAYGGVCVSLCVLMCVVVCELSQTPPDLCLRRLISAVYKGALCALQDRLSGQWIHCLTTPSPPQANWYAPLSPEIIESLSLSTPKVIIEWECRAPRFLKACHQVIHLDCRISNQSLFDTCGSACDFCI